MTHGYFDKRLFKRMMENAGKLAALSVFVMGAVLGTGILTTAALSVVGLGVIAPAAATLVAYVGVPIAFGWIGMKSIKNLQFAGRAFLRKLEPKAYYDTQKQHTAPVIEPDKSWKNVGKTMAYVGAMATTTLGGTLLAAVAFTGALPLVVPFGIASAVASWRAFKPGLKLHTKQLVMRQAGAASSHSPSTATSTRSPDGYDRGSAHYHDTANLNGQYGQHTSPAPTSTPAPTPKPAPAPHKAPKPAPKQTPTPAPRTPAAEDIFITIKTNLGGR